MPPEKTSAHLLQNQTFWRILLEISYFVYHPIAKNDSVENVS